MISGPPITERLRSLRCVMFDLDGVLFDGTNSGYFYGHRHALASVGVEVPPDEHWQRLLECWSHPHKSQLSLFIHDEKILDEACRAYEAYLFSDEFAKQITGIPGAAQTIKELASRGYSLAVASGMHHRQIPDSLLRIGIDPSLFTVCISAYQLPDEAFQRPHPYMLNTILNQLHTTPQSALYIGDSKTDIQMARAAGVLAAAVLTGNMSRAEAESEEPNLILDSVSDIVDLIDDAWIRHDQ